MRRADWMLAQLPVGMLEDDFFARFVGIFQEVGSTLLEGADNLENLLDVTVTPEPFVPYLASWTGAPAVDASLSGDRQRAMVRSWARLLAWRGTRRGLTEFLQMICGSPAEVTDSGGVLGEGQAQAGPPWVRVRVSSTGGLPEADLAVLARDEVPAHVFLELWVGDRRLLPPPAQGAPA